MYFLLGSVMGFLVGVYSTLAKKEITLGLGTYQCFGSGFLVYFLYRVPQNRHQNPIDVLFGPGIRF